MPNRSPFTFSLATARHLPVTGSLHPLHTESARWLSAGNAVAVVGACLLIAGFSEFQRRVPPDEKPPVQIVNAGFFSGEFDPPPAPGVQNYTTPELVQPPDGTFEPVDRVVETLDDPEPTFGGTPGVDTPDGTGDPGGGLFDGVPREAPPAGQVYEWFDELPVCLHIAPPVYPDLARQAGIDGTVVVQVLVGRDGKVRDARVMEGPEPLHEAALASVRTARFKPAMQGTRPVDVWVTIPVVFELQGRR